MSRWLLSVCCVLTTLLICPWLPGQEENQLKLGIESYGKNEFDKAIVYFSEAIQQNPKQAAAYFNRGNCYAAKNDYEHAIADWSQAIQLDPSDPEGYNNRGNAYVEQGQYDKAIADADAALKINPKLAEAFSMRGVAYQEKGDLEKAFADFSEAIKIEPQNVAALHNRGRAYAIQGESGKAKADFEKLIEINPKDAVAHSQMAWQLATSADPALRDGKKAVIHARLACEQSEWKDAMMIQPLAAAYAESGDYATAVQYQKKYLETPNLNERNADEAKMRLDLYEGRLPYRQRGRER